MQREGREKGEGEGREGEGGEEGRRKGEGRGGGRREKRGRGNGGGATVLPEIPYPGHTVFSSRVHIVSIVIKPEARHVLCHTFKHIHLCTMERSHCTQDKPMNEVCAVASFPGSPHLALSSKEEISFDPDSLAPTFLFLADH